MPVRLPRGFAIRRFAPAGLMPAGAFAVHQLRYWLAYGSRAGVELQKQGHSYLHSVVPWIVLAVAAATGSFLLALGRAFGGRKSLPRYTVSVAMLWLLCSTALVAIYICQEFLEGLLATGHPGGLVGIFGYGGWWSIPAAIAVGLVLTAAFHGARRVLQAVADRYARSSRRRPRRSEPARIRRGALLRTPVPLVDGWSGRGPPA
ncbi:MAG: hypothetical protein JO130_11180 [Solirubrobacterales bacterium]|nr:hypothetical protein [Solirubrobacterales bacterium]